MIVITGGTGRLGTELISLLNAAGKTTVSIARHENPSATHNLICNLRQSKDIVAAAKEIQSIDEPIEVIINAAGFYEAQALGEITEDGLRRNMAIHAEAPMLLVSNLIEKIKKDGTDIVNVSSIAAIHPSTGSPGYGASKSALCGFSADLRLALKKYPSRVITLYPEAFGSKPEDGMNVQDIAQFIKQILELPKNVEISEALINRKSADD